VLFAFSLPVLSVQATEPVPVVAANSDFSLVADPVADPVAKTVAEPVADLVAEPVVKMAALPESALRAGSGDSFSNRYTAMTKKILLAGIKIERFSLNFRLQSAKQPKFRKIRYFAAQESSAAGGLAFEIAGVREFSKGRRKPLQINKTPLRHGLNAAMTTAIIAGSSSAFELSLNVVQGMKNKKNGFDHRTADRYIATSLKEIDALLLERSALVAANSADSSYARAMAEGEVLAAMRNAFANEYAHFSADTKSYLAFQNLFYVLNASYNAVGAVSSRYAYCALAKPYLNGTANILFIVNGAMATLTPVICTTVGTAVKKRTMVRLTRQLDLAPFDPDAFALSCKNLEKFSQESGSLMPSMPVTERVSIYTTSNQLFTKQLDSETKVMRKLEKVALQTSFLGPVIGSTLLTQGILGTYGYYHYPLAPRKQINQYYRGAVIGTVGTGMAVVGNAASILGTMSYEHKLAKNKQLPAQLIQKRLEHLDETEKLVVAL